MFSKCIVDLNLNKVAKFILIRESDPVQRLCLVNH